LGLRTLGDVAALPEAAVLGRFGRAGVHARALARGGDDDSTTPQALPPDLVETIELDPPAAPVDEAAFAAKTAADRLLARLDDLGLSCMQVVVEAETEHGERLTRSWRHEGRLTPTTLATRMRWQLEAWITAGATDPSGDDAVTGGLTLLRLTPEVVA